MYSESSTCQPLFAWATLQLQYRPNGLWNIYEIISQIFLTTWRPRLYVDLLHIVHLLARFDFEENIFYLSVWFLWGVALWSSSSLLLLSGPKLHQDDEVRDEETARRGDRGEV